MGRKDFINELIDFIGEYKLLDVTKERIERYLEDSVFIEELIELFITKAKYLEDMDFERLNKLLSVLEDIRLELEYGVGCL